MNHRTISGVLVIVAAMSGRALAQVPFDVPTLPSLPVIVDTVPSGAQRPAPTYDPNPFNPNQMINPSQMNFPPIGPAYPNSNAPNPGYGGPAYPGPNNINQGYPNQNLPVPSYPNQGMPNQGYPNPGYPNHANSGGFPIGQDPANFNPNPGYPVPMAPIGPNSGYPMQGNPSLGYANPVSQGPPVGANQGGPDQGTYIPAMPTQVTPNPNSQAPAPGTGQQSMAIPGPGVPLAPNTTPGPLPRELFQSSLPPYTIAPPDILFIDSLRMIPRPPYRIEALEVLLLNVSETLPNQPIVGPFTVSPDGFVSLGFGYGSVRVAGLTLEQAQENIRRHLGGFLRNPQVSLALAQFRGMQQVRGQHLVRPDGTIGLGTFGSVYVAGMTLGQAKAVVERHLSNYLLDPQVSIDVFAYNSKVYYVIIDGGGYGQQVFRMPITGNETVLDAIGRVQGLAPVSSKKRIWLARPSPGNLGYRQVMPVDWNAITQAGATDTNYQVFPGDRIYVQANCLIEVNNRLAQVLAPINQLLGVTFLGTSVFQSFKGNGSTSALLVRINFPVAEFARIQPAAGQSEFSYRASRERQRPE